MLRIYRAYEVCGYSSHCSSTKLSSSLNWEANSWGLNKLFIYLELVFFPFGEISEALLKIILADDQFTPHIKTFQLRYLKHSIYLPFLDH